MWQPTGIRTWFTPMRLLGSGIVAALICVAAVALVPRESDPPAAASNEIARPAASNEIAQSPAVPEESTPAPETSGGSIPAPAENDRVAKLQAVMQRNPRVYFYICQNAFRQRVLRASRRPLENPGGRHRDRPVVLPDAVINGLSVVDFAELRIAAREHNASVATAAADQSASELASHESPSPLDRPKQRPAATRPVASQTQSSPPGNVIPTEFAQTDQRLIYAVALAIHSHPEMYYYVCKNERDQEIVRALREATTKPGGKYAGKPPIVVVDIKFDQFGTRPQPDAKKYIEELCAKHNEKRAAGVIVAKGPVPHLMGGFGVAPGAFVSPDPRLKPKPRQPDPPTKNPSQAAYALIAKEITESYRHQGNDVDGNPLENLKAAMEKNDWETPIQKAAGHIAQLSRDSAVRLKMAKVNRDNRIQSARNQMARAERGDYIREETRTYTDSNGRTFSRTYTFDDSDIMYARAKSDLAAAETMTDVVLQFKNEAERQHRLHSARAHAWDELVPIMPQRFAGPVSKSALVNVRFVPKKVPIDPVHPYPRHSTGYSERFQGQYVATNVAGRELRHVTFAVDFYHFSTGSDATTRHVYYIPRWGQGEEIELSRILIPGNAYVDFRYKIPTTGHINDPPHFELDGMAGVIKLEVTVWSNEATQEKTSIIVRERAETIAPILLGVAEKTLTNSQFNFAAARPASSKTLGGKSSKPKSGLSSKQGGPPKKPALSMEERATNLMAAYLIPLIDALPESSPYSQKARRYLVDPKGARESLQQETQTGLTAACTPGKQYEGTFNGRNNNGKLGIIFTECSADGKSIRAEIYNPKTPSQTRPLGGYIALNSKTTREFIFLAALAPASEWEAPKQNQFALDPFRSTVLTYGFELADGKLKGMCTTGNSLEAYIFTANNYMSLQLDAAPSDAGKLKEAQQRVKANRKLKVPQPVNPRRRGRR